MNTFQSVFMEVTSFDLKDIIEQGAFLADVRTAGEFMEGHVKGSVNIPLDSIQDQLDKFKNKKNIVVFCRSGSRSNMAKNILQQHGFTNVINAGTWENVNRFVK